MQYKSIRKILFGLSLFLFFGCGHQSDDAISQFTRSIVNVPYQKMDKRICSMFYDSIRNYNSDIRIVHYLEMNNCISCELINLAQKEFLNYDSEICKNVSFCYIVQTSPQHSLDVYKQFCKERIQGTVYLDTCNAFMEANPQMPDNEMFHTFVINREGKVLMVGNPFANEKMEALFKKVIAKERKKFKNKMTYT